MSSLDGFYLFLSVTCRRCKTSVPINGLVEALPCPHCTNEMQVPLDGWLSLFDAETVDEVREMEPGYGSEKTLIGSIHANAQIAHRLPRCQSCKEDVPVGRLAEFARAGRYGCSCGKQLAVREAPAFARAFLPGARWVVDERLAGGDDGTRGATQPILFACMGCGGSLSVDGSDRAVTCSYCGASNFLPDALWHRLHPVPTVEPFCVVVDSELAAKGDDLGPELFERMAASDDSDVRAVVARNAAIPPRMLAKLAKDEDWDVRAAVASNPSAGEGLLAQLLGDDDSDVREAVAARPNLPQAVLDKLVEDQDWEVRRAAVGNPRTSMEALALLAGRETDNDVLTALGQRQDLAPEVLRALVGNPDQSARRAAARNPATPADALTKLSKDSDRDVRRALARRSDLPEGALLRLGGDTDLEVREAARSRSMWRELRGERNRKLLLAVSLLVVAASGLIALAYALGWLS